MKGNLSCFNPSHLGTLCLSWLLVDWALQKPEGLLNSHNSILHSECFIYDNFIFWIQVVWFVTEACILLWGQLISAPEVDPSSSVGWNLSRVWAKQCEAWPTIVPIMVQHHSRVTISHTKFEVLLRQVCTKVLEVIVQMFSAKMDSPPYLNYPRCYTRCEGNTFLHKNVYGHSKEQFVFSCSEILCISETHKELSHE